MGMKGSAGVEGVVKTNLNGDSDFICVKQYVRKKDFLCTLNSSLVYNTQKMHS